MHLLTNEFYKSLNKKGYGKSIGEIQLEAVKNAWNVTGENDPLNRLNLEQSILHSDPAIIPFPFPSPDYTTSKELISFLPGTPNVANDSVWLKVKFANIGRAVKESVEVLLQREGPDGKIYPLLTTTIDNLTKLDSVQVKIGLKGMYDGGINFIIATIDPANKKSEITKINNSARFAFDINTTAIVPVFPYDLSIVNNAAVVLTGSTANPAAKSASYRIQIDTSRYFNSTALVTFDTTSLGGAINFKPNINWKNNTVYYWRLSPVSLGVATNWSHASFLYQTTIGTGFNQSHFFQHLQSG